VSDDLLPRLMSDSLLAPFWAGHGHHGADWDVFMGHVRSTLDKFGVPVRERGEVLRFIDSLKANIVET
jgi:hypothetical protein